MAVSTQDRDILRRLAGDLAEIAALPVHAEKAELWRRLNDREEGVRPLVWINEICWGEMNVDDELTCRCADGFARNLESRLRQEIYQWRHLPGDMVVSDSLMCRKSFESTSMDLAAEIDVEIDQGPSGITSSHFKAQHLTAADAANVREPIVTAQPEVTERNYQAMCEIFDGVMPVKIAGIKNHWYAPWDLLVGIWGVQEAMIDLIDRPEAISAFVERIVHCNGRYLDQLEQHDLLECNNDNTRVGSGGYGCTSELPGEDYDPEHVRLGNQWGCATAQIFSEVSPEMHWEFALKHEMKILERFGLTYYGCCEPLDIKMGILRRVPNLRKVSMSPWVDPERGAAECGREYVYSLKPNPAILAEDTWRPERARAELRETLAKTRGCNVEVILKDISTVRSQPQRLWQWAQIAMEEAQRLAD